MLERSAIPDTPQRRNLIVSSPLPSLQRQSWIGAHVCQQDIVLFKMLCGHGVTFDGDEFIVGVERRRVAPCAILAGKDCFPSTCCCIEWIGVRRRPQRTKELSQSI